MDAELDSGKKMVVVQETRLWIQDFQLSNCIIGSKFTAFPWASVSLFVVWRLKMPFLTALWWIWNKKRYIGRCLVQCLTYSRSSVNGNVISSANRFSYSKRSHPASRAISSHVASSSPQLLPVCVIDFTLLTAQPFSAKASQPICAQILPRAGAGRRGGEKTAHHLPARWMPFCLHNLFMQCLRPKELVKHFVKFTDSTKHVAKRKY